MNILKNIINELEDNKAINIVSIDVKEKTSITDYMVFATGTSNRHVHSLSRSIYESLKKNGFKILFTSKLVIYYTNCYFIIYFL